MELLSPVDLDLACAYAHYLLAFRHQLEYSQLSNQDQQYAQSISLSSNTHSVHDEYVENDHMPPREDEPLHMRSNNAETHLLQSDPQNIGSCSRKTSAVEKVARNKLNEWACKLENLSSLFSSLSNGNISPSYLYANLSAEFCHLSNFLSHVPLQKRALIVFDTVEIYAGCLVKLHQYSLVTTNCDCEELLYSTVHEIISTWVREFIKKNSNYSKCEEKWMRIRAVITRMFRNIIIQKCIIALKHSLASMLSELTSIALHDGEHRCSLYACEELETLMLLLSSQASFVSLA